MQEKQYLRGIQAVILAGGNARRLGAIGGVLPKPLLPVTQDDTLLTRNLKWLLARGCPRILISTSPDHYDPILWVVNRFIARQTAHPPNTLSQIEVLCNQQHMLGPVAALAKAYETVTSDLTLLCLSDICFLNDPFAGTQTAAITEDTFYANVVFAQPFSTGNGLHNGGIALVKENLCYRLCLRAEECVMVNQSDKHFWSGMAILERSAWGRLANFTAGTRQVSEEDFLNHCINHGHKLRSISIPPFINVNTYDDYLRVINILNEKT